MVLGTGLHRSIAIHGVGCSSCLSMDMTSSQDDREPDIVNIVGQVTRWSACRAWAYHASVSHLPGI